MDKYTHIIYNYINTYIYYLMTASPFSSSDSLKRALYLGACIGDFNFQPPCWNISVGNTSYIQHKRLHMNNLYCISYKHDKITVTMMF